MKPVESEECKRLKCTVKGQNCYVLVGKTFCIAKLPHENRPENKELREVVDEIGATVSRGMMMMLAAGEEQEGNRNESNI